MAVVGPVKVTVCSAMAVVLPKCCSWQVYLMCRRRRFAGSPGRGGRIEMSVSQWPPKGLDWAVWDIAAPDGSTRATPLGAVDWFVEHAGRRRHVAARIMRRASVILASSSVKRRSASTVKSATRPDAPPPALRPNAACTSGRGGGEDWRNRFRPSRKHDIQADRGARGRQGSTRPAGPQRCIRRCCNERSRTRACAWKAYHREFERFAAG